MRRLNAVADPVSTTTPATPARKPRRSTTDLRRHLGRARGRLGSHAAAAGAACGVASRHSSANVADPGEHRHQAGDDRQSPVRALRVGDHRPHADQRRTPTKPSGATIHGGGATPGRAAAPSRIDDDDDARSRARSCRWCRTASTASCFRRRGEAVDELASDRGHRRRHRVHRCRRPSSPAASAGAGGERRRSSGRRPVRERRAVVRCRHAGTCSVEQHATMIATARGDVRSIERNKHETPGARRNRHALRTVATYAPGRGSHGWADGARRRRRADGARGRGALPRARRHARARGWPTATRPCHGWREHAADLVVLDVMLPGADGLTLLRHIRADGDMPVILLTARTEEIDRVVGLELGADDYVVKPFSPRELAVRVRNVLRRTAASSTLASTGAGQQLHFGDPMSAPSTSTPRHARCTVEGRVVAADAQGVRPARRARRLAAAGVLAPPAARAGVGLGAGVPGPGDRHGAHRTAAPEARDATPSTRAGSSRRGASATGSSREPRRRGTRSAIARWRPWSPWWCSPPAPSAPGWRCAP